MKISFGVTKTRDDEQFISSFINLYEQSLKKYEVNIFVVQNSVLCDAQNMIAEGFLRTDSEYLILFDDDHSGHTVDMIDCLIGANAYMATMKTYSRHFPYYSALMKRVWQNNSARYVGIDYDTGYIECDLTGFPMTALRRDLFSVIERPFFRQMPDSGGRTWATDEEFCIRLEKHGIKPIGCNQHILNHGDITPENVLERRKKDMPMSNGIYSWVKRQRMLQLKTNSNSDNERKVKGE